MKKHKKNALKSILWSIVFVAIILLFGNLSGISCKIGKNLLEHKQYEKALPYFELAIMLDKDDLDAYYYYAQALNELPMSYDVQKKLFELSQNSKSGAAASLASHEIAKYKYFILTQAGPNYIQQTPYQDKVLRWDPKTFPLKVYIQPKQELPKYYFSAVQQAFISWSKATNGYLKFEFINTEQNADIDFRFINKDNSQCKDQNCKYVLAYATPTVTGNKLKKFDIKFSTTDNYNQLFKQKDIYLASMHEIGHALGIMGHSFNEDNLMYPSNVEENPLHSKFRSRGITLQDINTIRLLYAIKPDVSNGSYSFEELKKLVYAPIILGNSNEINNQKLEQAKKYIKNAPNLPNGYIDMASAYYELGNYQEAIQNLYKAMVLTSTDDAKFPILYNMTIVYYEARDYDNALIYAQMALNIKNTDELNALAAYLKYKLGNKLFAQNELKTLLKKNPANIDAAQYLIKSYIDEKRYFEAGTVLQQIKAAVPEVADDARIAQFGFLNIIFK